MAAEQTLTVLSNSATPAVSATDRARDHPPPIRLLEIEKFVHFVTFLACFRLYLKSSTIRGREVIFIPNINLVVKPFNRLVKL